jgi:DNA-binding transcriptional MerR regulator
MPYKVKEVADIAGVSVRTLHHYDEIGLLRPEFVSGNGYRFYIDKSLERLQQILFFKEIGFNLEEIKEILDSPGFDRKKALESHKELLLKKKERLEKIIGTVEKTINSIKGEKNMKKKDMFKGFDMSEIEEHQKKYADEAKQKWGNTDAYKESARKTARYTKEDWARIQSRNNEIYQKFIDNMAQGPAGEKVQEAVAEWRQNITDNFYNCTPEIARGLGEMYVSDPRFTANIDKFKEGLAAFMRDAINIYCDKLAK